MRTAEIVCKRLKGVPLDLTPKQRKKQSRQEKRRWKRWKKTGWHANDEQRPWTQREVDLLGTAREREVDPILWTKIGHFFATLLLVFQTSDFALLLRAGRCCGTVRLAG
jgi:hypothetical protein